MTNPNADLDFAQLYGMADNSSILYPEGWVNAAIEAANYGQTKSGDKNQWVIKIRVTEGEMAGKIPVTGYITVTTVDPNASPEDQQKQKRSLGIMFRRLAALGVPVPDPKNPQAVVNGQAPFWVMGWNGGQVAQAMAGRAVRVKLAQDEYDGVTRNKIGDWAPAAPGAPTTWPQAAAAQAAPSPFVQPQGYGQPPAGYGQPQQPWGQQQPVQPPPPFQPPQQPWQGQQQPPAAPWGQQPQQAPWSPPGQPQGQQMTPQYPPAQYPPAQPVQGQEPAQPQFPGQVVPQGQDPTAQQQWQQPGQGVPAVAQPPWQGQQGQPQQPQQWNGSQPAQPQQPGQPGMDGAPPVPPWMQ
jgi:hypothetical protein